MCLKVSFKSDKKRAKATTVVSSYLFEFFSEPYRTALQQPVSRSKRYSKFNEKRHFTVIPLSSYHGLLLVAHLGQMAN